MSIMLKMLLARWQTAVAGTDLPLPPAYDDRDIHLTRLTEKTHEVEPGACFVARVRTNSDGHPYIGKAIMAGASMILAQRSAAEVGVTVPADVVYWQVEDTAETLAYLAAAWHHFPSRSLTVIGITGTDGKSTTARLLHEILVAAGLQAGLLSTIKAVIGQTEEPLALHVTTPEAPVVQQYLRRMVEAGLTHCVLETTSHGLAQHRVTGINFDVAIVTNITHEHLDYHGDYAGYLAAKSRLFRMAHKTAVLNRDDQSYKALVKIDKPHQSTYGIYQPANFTAQKIEYSAVETRFQIVTSEESWPICTPLVGEFNVYNMLAAATAAYALGISPKAIQTGLQAVKKISGRMERINEGQSFLTIVDFAHTPNALEKAIAAARRMTTGRIITVFGSAGKRDVHKRRLMAEISARDADVTILTAEDPRTESLTDILETMAEGCRYYTGVEGETFWRITDRGKAIYHALTLAGVEDLVLICGKGHEQSMCFGTVEYPWDDRQATKAALNAFLQQAPMVDLGLPTFSS